MCHPNIVKLIGITHLDNGTYNGIVLELMDRDLHSFYRNNPLLCKTVEFQTRATRELLSGLKYMHSHGILNRDIKPHNILVRGNYGPHFEIKYCDFGSAKGKGTVALNVYGTHEICTLWYRPIETLLGDNNQGPHIDVWSLACSLYEVFTGNVAFVGDCIQNQIQKIFEVLGTPCEDHYLRHLNDYKSTPEKFEKKELPLMSILESNVAKIIRLGLEYDPKKRASASELLNFLDN